MSLDEIGFVGGGFDIDDDTQGFDDPFEDAMLGKKSQLLLTGALYVGVGILAIAAAPVIAAGAAAAGAGAVTAGVISVAVATGGRVLTTGGGVMIATTVGK